MSTRGSTLPRPPSNRRNHSCSLTILLREQTKDDAMVCMCSICRSDKKFDAAAVVIKNSRKTLEINVGFISTALKQILRHAVAMHLTTLQNHLRQWLQDPNFRQNPRPLVVIFCRFLLWSISLHNPRPVFDGIRFWFAVGVQKGPMQRRYLP